MNEKYSMRLIMLNFIGTTDSLTQMATILVLDDFPEYCDELSAALARDGNILRAASGVREAIDIGVLLEPDVLITDWMLGNHVNGLDVAEVLKQVYPSMQTILMSGYASKDLIEDAKQFGVVEFLEKPFPLESVRKALQRARLATRAKTPPLPIGIVETFSDGTIGHTNVVVEEMMAGTIPGAFAVKFSEYFTPDDWSVLNRNSLTEWIAVSPQGERSKLWHLRSKEIKSSGVRVWALLDSENAALKNSAINLRLLGFAEAAPEGLEKCGHVLVVDDNGSVRRLANEMLRAMKLFCHTAEDSDAAIRIYAHDPDITHVIIDYSMPDGAPTELIRRMKELRPQVCVIGSSSNVDRTNFEQLGVTQFLPKPWDYSSFLQALTQSVPEVRVEEITTPNPFNFLSLERKTNTRFTTR